VKKAPAITVVDELEPRSGWHDISGLPVMADHVMYVEYNTMTPDCKTPEAGTTSRTRSLIDAMVIAIAMMMLIEMTVLFKEHAEPDPLV